MTVEIEKDRDLIYGYIRVSSRKQIKGYSLEDQTEMITIKVKHLTELKLLHRPILRFYVDKGKSGSTMVGRDNFLLLMDDAEKEDPYGVVVTKLNRWGRNSIEIQQNVHKIVGMGLNFVCLEHDINTSTPMGKFFLAILADIAQLDRDQIIENTQAGIKRAREKGVKFGRKRKKLDEKSIIEDLNVAGLSIVNVAVKRKVSEGTIKNRLKEWGYAKQYDKTFSKEEQN